MHDDLAGGGASTAGPPDDTSAATTDTSAPSTTATASSAARPKLWRPAGRGFVELFCLSGFALAQPLLDVFGKTPDVFIFREVEGGRVVLFALLVLLVPPLGLWVAETTARAIDRKAGDILHIAFVAGLLAILGVQVLKRTPLPKGVVVALGAVALAAAVTYAYVRFKPVRDWVLFAALAPIAFLAMFLVGSPASDLVAAGEVQAAVVQVTKEPHSIVMVVWDEWPLESIVNKDGRIDPELFPNLAALAGDGGWYRNATTAATATNYAVPALLSGRFPEEGVKTPIASQYPENLFTLLAGTYDLEVTESITRLCPTNLCTGPFVDNPATTTGTGPGGTGTTAAPAEPETPATSGLTNLLKDAWQAYSGMVTPGESDQTVQGFADAASFQSAATSTTTIDPAIAERQAKAVEEARNQQGFGNTGPGGQTPGQPPGSTDPGSTDPGTPTTTAAPANPFGAMGMAEAPVLRLDGVEKLVGSIEKDEKPALHFLHLQLPHSPYRFLPDGRTYSDVPAGQMDPAGMAQVMGNASKEQAAVDVERQRLIMQAGYVDDLVGDIVTRLKDAGLYDDAIIVMTSDHGAGFVPGESIRGMNVPGPLNEALYPDMLYVPLLIKGPGIAPGTVSDANAMSVDIVPTIADLIGATLPWTVDGRSLVGPERTDDTKQFHKVGLGAAAGGAGMAAGPTTTFDGAKAHKAMLERNIDMVLRSDNPTRRLFDVDDAGEIVGTRVDALTVGTDSGLTASIDRAERYAAYDPAAGVVPIHVEGHLDGGVSGEQPHLALAVNGVIAAVDETYAKEPDTHHIEMMMWPDPLVAGSNTITVYVVEGSEGARTLRPVRLA